MGYISSIIKVVNDLKSKISTGQILPISQNPSGKFLKDNGTWDEVNSTGGIKITVGPTEPTNPSFGDIWINTNEL